MLIGISQKTFGDIKLDCFSKAKSFLMPSNNPVLHPNGEPPKVLCNSELIVT